jgi:6-phosphogluconolactonase
MALYGEERVVDDVPQAFAALVHELAPASIALSGGGTARRCYELLAVADVDWRSVGVWFGDERWVPIHDRDSNEGMARVSFLDEVEPRAIHSMKDAGPTIEAAAQSYDDALRGSAPIELVHLGLGPDGHTASLFPGSPALTELERLVVPTGDDEHPHQRLTLTYAAIARSSLAVFTVAGADKRGALEQVKTSDEPPAARVRAERVVWLVDRAAAGEA